MTSSTDTRTAARQLAIHVVTHGGLRVAARLAAALGAEVRVAEPLASLAPSGAVSFRLPMREDLASSFHRYHGHVFVMAIGATVRLVAPLLQNKWRDPAVVCVDEAGRFAVSVLSGHAGGGNRLTEEVAAALGAQPVITTASDVLGTLQVDLLGREKGWTFEDPAGNATRAASAMVNDAPIQLVQETGESDFWTGALPANVRYATSLGEAEKSAAAPLLLVTDRLPEPQELPIFQRAVIYRPKSLVLGLGCDRGAPVELVARGVERLLERHRLAIASVRTLATIDLKGDEPAFRELSRRLGCPLQLFTAAELDGAAGVESYSETVERHVGTRAVAEPAALLAAGAPRLRVPKQIYTEPGAGRSLTMAVASIPFPLRERRPTDG